MLSLYDRIDDAVARFKKTPGATGGAYAGAERMTHSTASQVLFVIEDPASEGCSCHESGRPTSADPRSD